MTVNEFADYVVVCIAFTSKLDEFTFRLVLNLDGLDLVQCPSTIVTGTTRGL